VLLATKQISIVGYGVATAVALALTLYVMGPRRRSSR
jgi:hypothetical protein